MIREHASELQGVEVREDTKRVYDYPEYFSHILGYTGKISDSEYDSLHEQNESYTRSDVVGKAGIEQVMELQLQGKKGSETVYVNNVGKVLDEKDYQEPSAGMMCICLWMRRFKWRYTICWNRNWQGF